jgi:hypothetical protein
MPVITVEWHPGSNPQPNYKVHHRKQRRPTFVKHGAGYRAQHLGDLCLTAHVISMSFVSLPCIHQSWYPGFMLRSSANVPATHQAECRLRSLSLAAIS